MKEFKDLLKQGIIKKQTPNINRAMSLIEEAKNKKLFLETTIKIIPKNKLNPNVIVD